MDRSRYETSRAGLERAGLVEAEEGELPPFVWVDGVLSREDALEHAPFQRCNKIPGMNYICYKSKLFKGLNEMRRNYPGMFDVYPKTFLLPSQFLDFQREHKAICGKNGMAPSWVVKPRNGCCGKGVYVAQSIAELHGIEEESVAQLYVHPYLIDRRKFDFRLYVLVASLEPLTIFIYREGITRFCTEVFEPPTRANRDKKFMHLTNTAINKENSDEPADAFTKLALPIFERLAKMDRRGETLWELVCEASRATIIGIYPDMLQSLPKKCDKRTKVENVFSTRKRPRPLYEDPSAPPEEPLADPVQMNPPKPASPITRARLGPKRPVIARVDVVKRHMNMVVMTGTRATLPQIPRPTAPTDMTPVVIGSIMNFQIAPKAPPPLPPQLAQNAQRGTRFHGRTSISPDCHRRSLPPVLAEPSRDPEPEGEVEPEVEVESQNPPTDVTEVGQRDENDLAAEPEKQKEKKPEDLPPLKLTKRYFHILGIDIILDSDMNPLVLELNDRPSLGVTVEFEKELKESVISEVFEHVLPDGRVRGDSPKTSRWEQIYPLPKSQAADSPWPEIEQRVLHPNAFSETPQVPIKRPHQEPAHQDTLAQSKCRRRKKNRRATAE